MPFRKSENSSYALVRCKSATWIYLEEPSFGSVTFRLRLAELYELCMRHKWYERPTSLPPLLRYRLSQAPHKSPPRLVFGWPPSNQLVHFRTLHYNPSRTCSEVVHAGISSKKIKKTVFERNEHLRADYIIQMAQYSPEQLEFLDEVSKNERTSFRSRGWSRKGARTVQKGVFVRERRFSATGLLTLDGMVSNTVIEGSMTRELFLEYLQLTVVCALTYNI